jgi:hypothetical protein
LRILGGVTPRVFLLSPASCTGLRAKLLLREEARFGLAARLREGAAPLGEVFAFLSGLYFRGKLEYARRFARPDGEGPGALVITPSRGLVSVDSLVALADLRAFAEVDIHPRNPLYREPLERDARRLRRRTGGGAEVVLLGSVATGKYVDLLVDVFGTRLLFPPDFVGRGDMSRGGLLLRGAREGRELHYVPVAGAVRHGPRPPRLPRRAPNLGD